MTDKPPPHVVAHGSTPLTQALQAARAAVGDEQDVARLRLRLESTLAADARPGVEAVDSVARLGPFAGKGWTLLLGAAVGFGVLTYSASRGTGPVRPAPVRAPVSAVSDVRAQPVAAPGTAAPGERGASGSVLGVPGAGGSVPAGRIQPETELAVPNQRVSALAREKLKAQLPRSVGVTPRALKPSVSDEPTVERRDGTRVDPDAEVALISRAQGLLARQPNQALVLLSEHERLFARGLLAQERDTLCIDAERALGQDAKAREHARAFVAQFPASPQARALKQWLAIPASGAADHNPQPAPVLTR